jgi:hypothetical protein
VPPGGCGLPLAYPLVGIREATAARGLSDCLDDASSVAGIGLAMNERNGCLAADAPRRIVIRAGVMVSNCSRECSATR